MFQFQKSKIETKECHKVLPKTNILKNHGIRYCVTIVTHLNL